MIIEKLYRKYKNKRRRQEIAKRFPDSEVNNKSVFDDATKLEGQNVINSNVNIKGSTIGFATVIGANTNLSNSKIGKFCSISWNVHVEPYTHPTNYVSIYPSFFNTINNYPFGKGQSSFDEILKTKDGYFLEIGNDVWIGENVILKGGIKIGDGAVIGMGAVVTKDVPPYAIVGGIPAKIIKYRFNQKTIDKLIRISWWNWPVDKIKENRNKFTDVGIFLDSYEK